jgi:hypothetical protein
MKAKQRETTRATTTATPTASVRADPEPPLHHHLGCLPMGNGGGIT